MSLSVGIVGLPNVGKSTLFNALLKRQVAFAANYPFATIEPNIGIVPVPDERLNKLAEVTKEEEKMEKLPPLVPATVKFVDIAGLVKGASEGAGLGNKFLSHVREVSVIAHVVRAFSDENVIKEGSIDPRTDYQTIQTELSLADLATVEKIASTWKNRVTIKPTIEQQTADKLFQALNKGIPAREVKLTEEEEEAARQFFLLSKKPEIVVLNVSEEDYNPSGIEAVTKKYNEILRLPSVAQDDNFVVICAKIESELSELSEEEQVQYLKDLGLEQSGLERLIKKAYSLLGLISFLTAGEKEIRAWTIQRGFTALMASGTIHTDFEKNFIKAEIVQYNDFIGEGPARNASQDSASVSGRGWKNAREKGKARMEGKDYIVKDGDVVEFKIGR